MKAIRTKVLRGFWQRYPDSEQQLKAWHAEAKNDAWRTPAEVKARYATASILKGSRVVFNIRGNKYRLVVKINYQMQIIEVGFMGTHKQYDAINAEAI